MGEAGTWPTQEVQVLTVVHIYCVAEETLHLGRHYALQASEG